MRSGHGRRALAGAAVVLALVASLQASAVAQGSGPFPDVSSDAYYAVPVARLAEQGVFAGTLVL